jgi:hypothetical protein
MNAVALSPPLAPLALADTGAVAGAVRVLLRLEGLALLLIATALYARLGAGWGRFALLFLVPDVSLFGYLGGPRLGAVVYNAGHSLAGPVLLALVGLLAAPAVLPLALIWAGHVGFDRALGYGLKYGVGFSSTHLGRVGRRGH